ETGRERFTDHAEYLKVTSVEIDRFVIVDGFLLLLQMDQTVTRWHRRRATSWRLLHSGPHTTMLTCGSSPSAQAAADEHGPWIPYGAILPQGPERCIRCNSAPFQQCGGRVPGIVDSGIPDLRPTQDRLPRRPVLGALDRPTAAGGEHQIMVRLRGA